MVIKGFYTQYISKTGITDTPQILREYQQVIAIIRNIKSKHRVPLIIESTKNMISGKSDEERKEVPELLQERLC